MSPPFVLAGAGLVCMVAIDNALKILSYLHIAPAIYISAIVIVFVIALMIVWLHANRGFGLQCVQKIPFFFFFFYCYM